MSRHHLAKVTLNKFLQSRYNYVKNFHSTCVVSAHDPTDLQTHRPKRRKFKPPVSSNMTTNQRLASSSAAVAAAATETVPAAANSATEVSSWYAGLWQAISGSKPVEYMQCALTELHDFTGLPWWATIVLSTVLFRTLITLPLTVYQHKITSRLENIALEMPAIVEELKMEAAMAKKKFNWTEEKTRAVYRLSLRKQWNNLIVRDNCHPAKTFIVLWGQIPLWICQSVALRNLVQMLPDPNTLEAKLIFTELTIGGFGWIPNLTEVDSSYILPVALGLLNLGIIEVQSVLRKRQPTRLQTYATNAFRGLSVFMIPIACSVPSALCVYWVSSSVYGLAQNLLMISPSVRRAVGIPITKSEISNPYEQLWNHFKVRTGQMPAPAKKFTDGSEKTATADSKTLHAAGSDTKSTAVQAASKSSSSSRN